MGEAKRRRAFNEASGTARTEDKEAAKQMGAQDFRRHIEFVEQATGLPFEVLGPDDPLPEVPGDGTGIAVSFCIGTRGELTHQAAKRAAKLWHRHTARYPKAHYVLVVAGWDADPRNLWEIPEARQHICRWARLARLRTLDDAFRYLDERNVGFLAACGAFGEEVRLKTKVPPPVVMQ
jgi:hypothetical protein